MDELKDVANGINLARTGEPIRELSPLEKMEALNAKVESNLAEFKRVQEQIEKAATTIALSGHSLAGQPNKEMTQAEKDQAEADRIIKTLK